MEKRNKANNEMCMLPHLKVCNNIAILKNVFFYTKKNVVAFEKN